MKINWDVSWSNLFAIIPVIVMTTLINVAIAFTLAAVVFLQLYSALGWSKSVSVFIACLVAALTHLYILMQPKIRQYISERS